MEKENLKLALLSDEKKGSLGFRERFILLGPPY